MNANVHHQCHVKDRIRGETEGIAISVRKIGQIWLFIIIPTQDESVPILRQRGKIPNPENPYCR